MQVYRIESDEFLKEFPPKGSLYAQGRWNRVGQWIVYTSQTVALAKLEMLANSGSKLPEPSYLRTFELAENTPLVNIELGDLPPTWSEIPYPNELSHLIGELAESGKYLGCIVPSAQSFHDKNILLFGDHQDFRKYVQELPSQIEPFDSRFK